MVVAPNGVQRNWISDEVPTHVRPDLLDRMALHSYHPNTATGKRHQKNLADFLAHPDFAMLAIGYDSWVTDRGKRAVWEMMKRRKLLLVADESHRIKTPSAKITKSVIAGAAHAPFRRILSGTPVPNGPFDVYSQIRMLDPAFWAREMDIGSFTAFKQYFGVWDKGYVRTKNGLQEYDVLDGYNNLGELYEKLKLISSRLTKDEVLDLPPKLYSKRYYEMTPSQARVYRDLENEFIAFLDSGDVVSENLVMVRLLRLQQILCGYVPVAPGAEPVELIDPKHNPRLKALTELLEDTSGKAITWAAWTRDIDLIMEALERMGRRPVRYDGRCSYDDLYKAKQEFKHGEATDFVANVAMSEGLTLNEAKITNFYNNNYNLRMRLQAEDRNHRLGQYDQVTYNDLVCAGTRDEDAIRSLVKKMEVSSTILGDRRKVWIG